MCAVNDDDLDGLWRIEQRERDDMDHGDENAVNGVDSDGGDANESTMCRLPAD